VAPGAALPALELEGQVPAGRQAVDAGADDDVLHRVGDPGHGRSPCRATTPGGRCSPVSPPPRPRQGAGTPGSVSARPGASRGVVGLEPAEPPEAVKAPLG